MYIKQQRKGKEVITMAQVKEKIGEYAYNRALQLIDYCGNIRGGVKGVYSPDYSPNNIRRLIISPDAVEVHYHITTGGNQKLRDVRTLDAQRLSRAYMDMNGYKSMLSVLSADRVCGSIEELVFITGSRQGEMVLNGQESDFKSLVKDMPGDPMQNLAKRFKRLHYITIADGVTHADYEMYLRTHQQDVKAKDFLSDTEFFGSAKRLLINQNWWENWSYAAQFYELDKSGSRLNTYFKDKKKKYEVVVEPKKAPRKGEVNTALIEQYTKAYNQYKSIEMAYTLCKIMQAELGVSNLGVTLMPDIPTSLPSNTEQTKEELQGDISRFIAHRNQIVLQLGECYKQNLLNVAENYPLTSEIMVHSINAMGGVSAKIVGDSFPTHTVNGVVDSVRVMCTTIVRYFINRDGGSKVTKYLQKESWLEGVK